MKKVIISLICSILVIAVAIGVIWYLGPRSEVTSVCPICGKLKETREILGLEYHTEIKSEELGDWYDVKGLRKHECEWRPVSSWEQKWGGRCIKGEDDGEFLFPLVELKRVEPLVKEKKFKELTDLYYEVHHDEEKHKLFMKKCGEVTP